MGENASRETGGEDRSGATGGEDTSGATGGEDTLGATGTFRRCNPRSITKRTPELPLPMPFELPRNFEGCVMADLKRKMMSTKNKGKFVKGVAAAIFRFKAYPTSGEYNHVGQQIILKYPFLKSLSGTGYVSSNAWCVMQGWIGGGGGGKSRGSRGSGPSFDPRVHFTYKYLPSMLALCVNS